MAMTMADSVIRKACDRCHSQKLSCKRIGDEACERCVRLQAECKSSPSLRYKKQQLQQHQQHHRQGQQQHQQQPQPHPHPLAQTPQPTQHPQQQQIPSETAQVGRRSPKRRRTASELNLVQPETVPIIPQIDKPAAQSHVAVVRDPVLEIGDFNFNFDQLEFFAAAAQAGHLSQPNLPGIIEAFHPTLHSHSHTLSHSHPNSHPNSHPHPHSQLQQPQPLHPPLADLPEAFANSWSTQHLTPVSDAYQHQVTPTTATVPQPDGAQPKHRTVPSIAFRRRACVTGSSGSGSGSGSVNGSDNKVQRPRSKNRPRQIALSAVTHASGLSRETSTVHWMAQLSEINARLLDLSSALPQQMGGQYNGTQRGRPGEERIKPHGFPIDEMFKLTRRVADILDRFSNNSSDEDSPVARQSRIDKADPGNSMFVLSTYVRLLDMYHRVFSLVHSELSHADSDVSFRFWKLPDVTVGSFAVESSPSLQMSLTIQLAEEFLSRLRTSTASLAPTLQNGDGHVTNGDANAASMFSDVVDVSYRAVKSKEEKLGKHLAQLRDEIEAFLDS